METCQMTKEMWENVLEGFDVTEGVQAVLG